MAIITLTTDWGLKDHYAATVKGKILSGFPEAIIVDISHQIPSFEIEQAAFVLKNTFPSFPQGTVHILGINTEESDRFAHTVVEYQKQYFIGTDNGIFSMLFDKTPDKIIELTILQESDFFTFSTRDRFVKAAIHLAQGNKIEELGDIKKDLVQKILFQPVIDQETIKGHVMYIDSYENIITNITASIFKEARQNRKFNIIFRSYEINKISRSYTDVAPGEILALFDSNGYLEIAINQGNAAGLLGLGTKDMIRIEFS
ncbi:MAG: SAM-dependent chlorinase/fluorinase [Bacteroidales bacterium]|nr:SAM-dependent chlorinase/fluorinase [Bacteroidales bacterium]MCF8404278.1 SAM-dependent chlorinase/fluorinase [Bacteroidales bacterium]